MWAFIITLLLTRIANIAISKFISPLKTALTSFLLISFLLLTLSSLENRLLDSLIIYIPCLLIILAFDVFVIKTKANNYFIPKKRQWEKWSLPSKLTAIGTFAGVISLSFYLLEKVYIITKPTGQEENNFDIYNSGVVITDKTNIEECKGEYLFRWNAPAFIGKNPDFFDKDIGNELDTFEILTVDGLGLIINRNFKLLAIDSEALSVYGGSNGKHIEKTVGFGGGGNWRIIIEDIKGSDKKPKSPFKIGEKYKPHNPINNISFNPNKTIPYCPETTSGVK